MSLSMLDLEKMIRSFRVADLQTLLQFAGRNKVGKKSELQHRALDLLKLRSQSIEVKIREIHGYRFSSPRGHAEMQEMHILGPINEPPISNYPSRNGPQPMYSMPGRNGMGMVPSRNAMHRHGTQPSGRYMNPLADMSHNKIMPPNFGPNMDLLNQYPLSPDLKIKELPFYDVLAHLIKPTSLIVLPNERFREKEFSFCFTPQQLIQLDRNSDVQVQMRMCAFDLTTEQDDEIPPNISVKVNNRIITLPSPIPTNRPGVEPKRPKRPIDITMAIKRSDTENNVVHISWASQSGKPHVFTISLVQRLSSSILIKRLKDNGVRNPDHTTAVIKEKLCQDRDSEIATMSLRGSLMCPLGKIKMILPCRALTCAHIQCFDATLYLQMNEKKPKWICPVCDKAANFKDLAIDGLFLDIISKAPEECSEVQFHENGSWTPVMPVVKKTPQINESILSTPPKISTPKPKRPVEVISLDSDSDTEDSWSLVAPPQKKAVVESDPDSLIIIDSPVNDAESQKNTVADLNNSYRPCSSKSEQAPFPSMKSVEKLEPETLVIDSDVDCIGNPPPLSCDFSGASGFEALAQPASNAFQDSKVGVSDISAEGSSPFRQYSGFNLFSLVQPPDDSHDSTTIIDSDEPEIIDIEDDYDDDD